MATSPAKGLSSIREYDFRTNIGGAKGTWIPEEVFDRIFGEVCDWYDKHIEQIVTNIQEL